MSDELFNIFYQSHAGSWIFLVIFFILSCLFTKQKVTPMILRLFYVIMLVSGGGMLYALEFPIAFVIKAILAVLLIGVMEMITGRLHRRESTGKFWIILVILLTVVVLTGYGVISY